MTIGEKLKALRGTKSQEEIATALGISKQALSNYENDIRIPRDEIKYKIAKYFGKTVDEIFFATKSNDMLHLINDRKDVWFMSFAKNLKIAMAEKQMTQSELAIAINKGKSSVSQYLSGRSVPRPEVQEKIAEVLDCSIEFLNSEETEEPEISDCNVSVAQAAKLLGKGEEFVRVSLQMGTAPFGFAAKTKTKWSYHISPKKLQEYIGGDALCWDYTNIKLKL